MAPKKNTAEGNTSNSKNSKSDDQKKAFNPENVKPKDRFYFKVCHEDKTFVARFYELIYFLRFCASYMASKKGFEKYTSKPITGFVSNYGNDLFIIVVVAVGEAQIELLFYKPNLYMLGVKVKGKWWIVTDFETHTNLIFPDASEFKFGSKYRSVPRKVGYYYLCDCICIIYAGADNLMRDTQIESAFKKLCVIFSESARFYDIFDVVVSHLLPHASTYRLTDEHESLVRSWDSLSIIWIIHEIGYIWELPKKKWLLLQCSGVKGDTKEDVTGPSKQHEPKPQEGPSKPQEGDKNDYIVMSPTDASQHLALLHRPDPKSILELLLPFWKSSKYNVIRRTPIMEKQDWELLEEMNEQLEKDYLKEPEEKNNAEDFKVFLKAIKKHVV